MNIHLPGGLVVTTDKDVAKYLDAHRRNAERAIKDVGASSNINWSALYESEHYQPSPDGDRVIHVLPWALRRRKWTYRTATSLGLKGRAIRCFHQGTASGNNLIPTEGRNNILDVWLHGTSQTTTWYIAPYEDNYTPASGDTASAFGGVGSPTESTAYDESTRVAFVEAAASSGSTDNSANKADFTFNATKTIYGCGLLSVSTKSSTSGVLASIALFSSSQGVVDDSVLRVTATISLTSS